MGGAMCLLCLDVGHRDSLTFMRGMYIIGFRVLKIVGTCMYFYRLFYVALSSWYCCHNLLQG
jgi:hypothetical protein